MTKKFTFPAGKYYVGDPCYAVKSENWSGLIDETGCFGLEDRFETTYWNWDDGTFMYNGAKCFADGTKYGDGSYSDNHGGTYGVDAGLIGIMPFDACDGGSMQGGTIIEFEGEFRVFANDKENTLLGSVWIDQTGAWNPAYEDGVKYLPINSALKLLGYMACQDVEIE